MEAPALWVLFFVSSTYGHLALKFAVTRAGGGGYGPALRAAATSPWGWSTVAAWGLSCVLWVVVLSRHGVMTANCISSLEFVLIGLGAWLFLSERATWTQILGMALIAGGIWLVK
jgi:drug/metabolite transporter (DMT)-like permease